MKVSMNEIHIRDRLRTQIGDIESLKASIQKVGLLNPILINEKKELISGNRRLETCRQLGWTDIEAITIDTENDKVKELLLEYHENLGRVNLTDEEARLYSQRMDSLLHPPARRNAFIYWIQQLWELIKKFFHKNKGVDIYQLLP